MRAVTADQEGWKGVPRRGILSVRMQFRNQDVRSDSVQGPAARTVAGPGLAEHKRQKNENDRSPRKLHVDILITLRLSLLDELMVDLGQGHAAAVRGPECAIKKPCERLSMLVKADGTGLHRLLQVLLMPHGAAGHLSVGDGDQD
jgi:hypothetical protein